MKTTLLITLILTATGCSTVRSLDSKDQIYDVTCSQAMSTMGDCLNEAQRACSEGYEIISFKQEDSSPRWFEEAHPGTARVVFKCGR